MQPLTVAIVDVNHTLLILSSEGTANGNIWNMQQKDGYGTDKSERMSVMTYE